MRLNWSNITTCLTRKSHITKTIASYINTVMRHSKGEGRPRRQVLHDAKTGLPIRPGMSGDRADLIQTGQDFPEVCRKHEFRGASWPEVPGWICRKCGEVLW